MIHPPIDLLAIGASAGGVEAIGTLLSALPAGFPAAVAVVLHLPPDKPSILPELFARRCALPVKEVEDKEPVKAGTVYIAAPDYHLLVEPDRRFSLSCDAPVHYSRPAIDLLFESAALSYRRSLLAIVLTGASADGAAGLRSVRRHGGSAWVQDPQEAAAPTMPQAAIKTAGADRILRVSDMAIELTALNPSTHK